MRGAVSEATRGSPPMLVLRCCGILLLFGAALPLVLSILPSVQAGYYRTLNMRQFWMQLDTGSLRFVETLLGDPHTSFFGQILTDVLHAPAWLVLGVPGFVLLVMSFARRASE